MPPDDVLSTDAIYSEPRAARRGKTRTFDGTTKVLAPPHSARRRPETVPTYSRLRQVVVP